MPTIDPRAHVSTSARLAADSRVLPGAYVGTRVELDDGTVVGPNAVLLDADAATGPTLVRHGVVIGANAVVHAGLTLAAQAVVRPGAVVTRSVPPAAIVEGNPATITGYVDTRRDADAALTRLATGSGAGVEHTGVRGVTFHRFPVIPDLRGNLTVGEFDRQIPFQPLRYFMVFGVPNREIRGEHAHRVCHQFLVCPRGSCAVVADDGKQRVEVLLDSPHLGIYLPPMTWGIQYKYSADALLLVFASHHYDGADYIRDYDEFKRLTAP
jgi:hypothetical protein